MKHNSILRIVLWSIVIAVLLLTLLGGLLFAKMPRIWHDHEWLEDTLEDRIEENLSMEGEDHLPSISDIPSIPELEQEPARAESSPSQAPYSAVFQMDTNIRKSPNLQSEVVGLAKAGETAEVKKLENVGGTTWAYISTPKTGWVVTDYLAEVPAETNPATDAGASGSQTFDAKVIRKIEIEWVVGSIKMEPADVDKITVSESSVTDSKYEMVCTVKSNENKLKIQFCDNAKSFFGIQATALSKDLTIQVPRDWLGGELEVDSAAANLDLSDLTLRNVEIESASGTVNFQNCTVDELDVNTASGAVNFTGAFNSLEFDTASASFTGVLENTPRNVEMDSASGDLDLTLPEDCGFTVSMEGMGSKFKSDYSTKTQGKTHVYGDGSCHIEVDSGSGSVTIRKPQ